MAKPQHIAILGGGPGGLAIAYYAHQAGIPFTLYEAFDRIGGNCLTLEHGAYRFDSGAHRLHGKDEEITAEVQQMLGVRLKKINVPSRIYHEGKLINFPLSPWNLLKKMGLFFFGKAGLQVLAHRFKPKKAEEDFESFALRTYGPAIAKRFLLNYSQKLWGIPTSRLSMQIAGNRMKELNLRTFILEAILGSKRNTKHFEGSFYYPDQGIGDIIEHMITACGTQNLKTGQKITKVWHDNQKLTAIELNNKDQVPVDTVISTLPINYLLNIMEPQPPAKIMATAAQLNYRNMIVVALFLNKPTVTSFATVYFPDKKYPFTRISEPRNRSALMSPPGKTSLLVEIPCQQTDAYWTMPEKELIKMVVNHLGDIGWIKAGELDEGLVHRMYDAYPILEAGYEEKIKIINDYLNDFSNLQLSGRNGCFRYSWLHDMLSSGRAIVAQWA